MGGCGKIFNFQWLAGNVRHTVIRYEMNRDETNVYLGIQEAQMVFVSTMTGLDVSEGWEVEVDDDDNYCLLIEEVEDDSSDEYDDE